MIRLSMNVISASISLIKIIGYELGGTYDELHVIYRLSDIDVDDLMEMLLKCQIVIYDNEKIILTKYGKCIIDNCSKNYEECIRVLLKNYILNCEPLWSKRIPFGRKEAVTFMSKDERSCFFECNLLDDNLDKNIVLWWDEISESIRKKTDTEKNEVGRKGELLTIEYEKKRVGKKPKWCSIDSNLLGYDIISYNLCDINCPLLIEVKTSTEDINKAYFYVSANEWQVAKKSNNYVFYLWSLYNNKKNIAVISPEEISSHIPNNNNDGLWEKVKIPFQSFANKFIEWEQENE